VSIVAFYHAKLKLDVNLKREAVRDFAAPG